MCALSNPRESYGMWLGGQGFVGASMSVRLGKLFDCLRICERCRGCRIGGFFGHGWVSQCVLSVQVLRLHG